MDIEITTDGYGHATLFIPLKVLEQVGWKVGDTIKIDIPTVYPDMLTLEKVEHGT